MEIELSRCKYPTRCHSRGCKARADTLVWHIDERGRFIRQVELCDEHVKWTLVAGGAKVHDRLDAVPHPKP